MFFWGGTESVAYQEGLEVSDRNGFVWKVYLSAWQQNGSLTELIVVT